MGKWAVLRSEGRIRRSLRHERRGRNQGQEFSEKTKEERWNQKESLSAHGLPWAPTPEPNGVEVKLHLRHRDEDET